MFNPNSRWDRRLPNDAQEAGEAVDVLCCCRQGKVIPQAFSRGSARIAVQRINHSWQERSGRSLLRYYSVSDGTDTYCLSLDSETMSWRLLHNC